MFKLIIADSASKDLEEIMTYISIKLANPSAATYFLDAVEVCYHQIEQNPPVFEKCKDTRLAGKGYCRAVIKNYIMLFKPDVITNSVTIIRFFYGKRDYARFI